jgi:hypothetical protein
MSTIQIMSEVPLDKLIEGLAQLDDQDLDELVTQLLAAQARRRVSSLSQSESDLLAIVNRSLNEEERRRFEELKTKRDAEQLTPQEHAELLQWTDLLEQQDLERLNALVLLAQLRDIPVQTLLTQLGIRRFEV